MSRRTPSVPRRREVDASAPGRDSLEGALRAVVRDELAKAQEAFPPWGWVSSAALNLSSRAALRLARKHQIPATRIAGKVFLERAALDRLAADNAIVVETDVADEDAVAADLREAFGAGVASRGPRERAQATRRAS